MPLTVHHGRSKVLLMLLAASLATLTACSREESAAKSALRESLKDPESAKFGDVLLLGTNGACIPVNAKNSFGGYTGWKMFALMKVNNKWIPLVAMNDIDGCKTMVEEMLKNATK